MVFHTSDRIITYQNLKINNINIEQVTQINFLDVMFNSHMDWNRHINCISMKISRSIGILCRLKDVYPQSVLTLYNTSILSHFYYCLLLWGSIPLAQKKAVRIIDSSHYIAHTEPICKVHNDTESFRYVFNCTVKVLLLINKQQTTGMSFHIKT